MRNLRRSRVSLGLTAALFLTACGDGLDLGQIVPDVTPSATASASGAGDPDGDGASDASEDGQGGDQASDGPGGPDQPDGTGTTDQASESGGQGGALTASTNDLGGVGSHGPAILRASVPNLVIEVDVQQGVSVDQAALDVLVNRIRQYADKPGGITVSGGNTFASATTEWTTDQMRAVAEANRNNHSNASTVVVYVLYLDGALHRDGEETTAIGVAYNASEFAVFPGRWAGLGGSLLGSDSALERAVLVHEWGHLLGMVNIGYTSRINHEDADHPHHSSSQNSVMYWAVETDLIGQFFNGAPPNDFDDADREDIEGIRDGSLVS